MDAELENALQTQYNTELQNEREYKHRGDVLESLAWSGSAHFMYKSADEERGHAQRFADYMIARNIVPIMAPLQSVPTLNSSLLPFFQQIYELEEKTTDKINALYRLADDVDDPQTCQFLHWFLEEQTNSVKETYDMVQELSRADCSAALLVLDEKYAEL